MIMINVSSSETMKMESTTSGNSTKMCSYQLPCVMTNFIADKLRLLIAVSIAYLFVVTNKYSKTSKN